MSILPKSRRQNGRNIARTCKSSRAGDCFALYLIYSATFIVSSSMRLTLVSRSARVILPFPKAAFNSSGSPSPILTSLPARTSSEWLLWTPQSVVTMPLKPHSLRSIS